MCIPTPQGPEMLMNVSALLRYVLLLEGPELHLNVCTTEACAAPGGVYTTGSWAAYERVCTTEACAAPGGVYTTGSWAAYERVCTTEACAAPGGVYTTRGLSLSGRVCTTEECAAPKGVYLHHRGLSCFWTYMHYRVLCCSWRCLIHRDQCLLTVECVRFASKIIFLLSLVFASLRK